MTTTITIPIENYSFELPVVQTLGGFLVDPPNSNWTWGSTSNGSSGITAENSNYTAQGLVPPDGVQAAFLIGLGYFSQMVTIPADGEYWLYFYATQNIYQNQMVVLYVDNSAIASYMPNLGTYEQIFSTEFPLGAGSHTISFSGLNATAEAIVVIDNITMQGILSSSTSLRPSTTIISPVTTTATATAVSQPSNGLNRTTLAVIISLSSVAIVLGVAVALIFVIRCLRRRPRPKNPYSNLPRQSWRSSKDDITTKASTATSPRSTHIVREPEKSFIRPDSPTLPDVAERFGVGRFLTAGTSSDSAPQPSAPPITNLYNDGVSNDSFWEKKSYSSLEKDTDSWGDLPFDP